MRTGAFGYLQCRYAERMFLRDLFHLPNPAGILRRLILFTIIFIDTHTSQVLDKYKYLFRPFELSGDIAFCPWNERESTANTAVQPLKALVNGRREWRAIIVNTDIIPDNSTHESIQCFVPNPQNPFDYTCCDPQTGPHESPIPIIRLSHILGGYASEPKREFDIEIQYKSDMPSDTDETIRPSQDTGFSDDRPEDTITQCNDKIIDRVALKPRRHDIQELGAYAELHKKYTLDFARPSEIELVSLRSANIADERRSIADAWKAPSEMASSTFWETNQYPNSCRFLTSDVTLNDVAIMDRDLTHFWYAILTLSLNKIPSASLQPYKLYHLNIELNRIPLQDTLNRHIHLLRQAEEYVQIELAKPPQTTPRAPGDPMAHLKEQIYIETRPDDDINYFEDLNDQIEVGKTSTDRINHEKTVQKKSSEIIEQKSEIIKDPRRGIERAAALVRQRVDFFSHQNHDHDLVLDKIQHENLQSAMAKLEKEVLTERPNNRFNSAKAREAAKRTREVADHQHDSVHPQWAFIWCGIVILIGFASYLWDAGRIGINTFLLSFLTVAIAELIVFYVGKLSYRSQTIRSRDETVKAYHKTTESIENDIKSTKDSFEQYFSNICSLMKYYSIADKINKYEDDTVKQYKMLEKHRNAIQEAIHKDSTWLNDFEMHREEVIDHSPRRFDDLTTIPPELHDIYSWMPSDECSEIPINNSGDMIRQPYAFVQKLIIEREEIYDSAVLERER